MMIPDDQQILLKRGISRSEAKRKIREQITKGYSLLGSYSKSATDFEEAKRRYCAWRSENVEILSNLFEEQSLEDYRSVSREAIDHDYIKQILWEQTEKSDLFQVTVKPSLDFLEQGERLLDTTVSTNDIFIVHGHDNAAKESVARFIEKLNLRTIILHEQPNAGRTIIEKFEDHSNVGFAIVLLTPDDIGAPRNQKDQTQPRARQNVILELGYFMGKLGRGRVCALYKEGVEIPSDYQGVLYIPMDSAGEWQTALAKEIKNAGIGS